MILKYSKREKEEKREWSMGRWMVVCFFMFRFPQKLIFSQQEINAFLSNFSFARQMPVTTVVFIFALLSTSTGWISPVIVPLKQSDFSQLLSQGKKDKKEKWRERRGGEEGGRGREADKGRAGRKNQSGMPGNALQCEGKGENSRLTPCHEAEEKEGEREKTRSQVEIENRLGGGIKV